MAGVRPSRLACCVNARGREEGTTPRMTIDSCAPDRADPDDPDGVIADAADRPGGRWPSSHPLAADAPVEPQAPTFAELGIDPRIVEALAAVGIERTFAIQALTLPIALTGARPDRSGPHRHGQDARLRRAAAAAARPRRAVEPDDKGKLPAGRAPRALVMVPTRELCVQVTRDLHQVGKFLGLSVTAVYGGRAYEPQIAALHAGVDVVVGTPGRLLDLANGGHLVLGGVKVLVLDEADEMLDLGFLPDMERVLAMVPDRQADHAVLGDDARPDPHPGPHVHVAADAHPGRGCRRGRDPHADPPVRLPRARAGQGGDARPGAAGPRTAA